MAILKNGLIGTSKKSIGNIVTYVLNGQQVARTKPATFKDANTVLQKEQRTSFITSVNIARLLLSVVRESFTSKNKTQSGYNAFISTNLKKETVFLPNGTFVASEMELSHGKLLTPYVSGTSFDATTKTITTTLKDNSDGVTGYVSDDLNVVVYDVTNERFTIVKKIAKRTELTANIVLSYLDGVQTPELVVYFYSTTLNGSDASDTVISV